MCVGVAYAVSTALQSSTGRIHHSTPAPRTPLFATGRPLRGLVAHSSCPSPCCGQRCYAAGIASSQGPWTTLCAQCRAQRSSGRRTLTSVRRPQHAKRRRPAVRHRETDVRTRRNIWTAQRGGGARAPLVAHVGAGAGARYHLYCWTFIRQNGHMNWTNRTTAAKFRARPLLRAQDNWTN